MASLNSDDCLLVGRNGVDYKVHYSDLVKSLEGDISNPVDIQLWNPPTSKELEWETAAGLYGTGVSACRGEGLGEHKVTGQPQHVQLKDGSHNYIVPAICGGGSVYGEPVYLLLLDNELNVTKRIEVPSTSKITADGFVTSFPNASPYPEESQVGKVYYSNILVWNHVEGIWTSTDYGDTWIKYEDQHGGTENYTSDNTRLVYTLNGQDVYRYHTFFNKVSATEFVFDGIKLTEYKSSLHYAPERVDPGDLWIADLPLSPDFDEYSWKECTMDTGKLELVSEHHAWAGQYFVHAEQHPWLEFADHQNAGNWLFCLDPDNRSWNIAEGWDKFPQMTIIKYQKGRLEKFQETVFKKHFQHIPENYILDDADYYLDNWFIAWDPGTESFFCRYDEIRNGFFDQSNSIYWLPDHILATRDMQTGWVPYRAKGAHPVDESVSLQSKTARKEVEVEPSVDERTGGSHFDTNERAYIHRLPGSSTGFFIMNGRNLQDVLMLDAPVNGVSEHWGDREMPWLISLKDGRLWKGGEVTKEPFYSLKKGLLINGHFIERPAYEVGSPLAGEVGGSV